METLKKANLFWDVDCEKLDPKKHGSFIVNRILERGNIDDLGWAKNFYGEQFLLDVFSKNARKFSPKTGNFWCLYFNLDKKECIREQLAKKHSPFWKS